MKYFFSKLIHFIKNLVEIHKCFGQGWVLKVHQGQGRRSAGRSLISVTRSLPRLPPRSNMRAMRVNYGPCRLSSHPNFHEIDLSLGDPWPMPRIASRPFCSNFNWFSWLTQKRFSMRWWIYASICPLDWPPTAQQLSMVSLLNPICRLNKYETSTAMSARAQRQLHVSVSQ